MKLFEGKRVMTAMITPLTDAGQLDVASLSKLVRLQEEAGNALVLIGSTGEGLALSLNDKKAILKHVFSLNPKVPIVIGVGGFQIEEQLEWLRYCQDHYPIAGFLLLTPLYAKPGIQGQIAWFKTLMDASRVPCILYNVPGRTAVKLHFPVLEALAKHPQLGGIKEASDSLDDFKRYQQIIPHLPTYSGSDELLSEHLKLKGFGEISVASNIWPHAINKYIELCLSGKNTPSQDALWCEASQSLFSASNPIPLKVLMYREGLIPSPVLRLPLTHLDLTEAQIQKMLQLSQEIKKAF